MQHVWMRRSLVGLLVLSVVLAIPVAVSSAPGGSRRLTIAVPVIPKGIGDRFAGNEWAIQRYNLGRLIVVDEKGKFQPWLALSWQPIRATVWQFKLRPNVKWQNGDPFDAEDVKFAFEFMLDPNNKHPQRERLKEVRRVEVVDPLTVNVHTDAPSGSLISNLPSSFEVLPAKYYRQVGTAGFDRNPVGVGPYKVKELAPGSHLTFVANALFWGEKPKFEEIVYRAVPEEATRLAALEAGEIDGVFTMAPENALRIKGRGYTVAVVPENRVMTLILACDRPNGRPLCDTRVRLALAMSIDKEAISQALYGGLFPVARGHPANPTMFGFNSELKPYPYDVRRARELLAEAGFADGFRVGLEYPHGRWVKVKDLTEAIAASFRAIGVTLDLLPEDSGAWLSRYVTGRTVEMTLSTLGPAFDLDFNTTRFVCTSVSKFFCDAEFDRLYVRQRGIINHAVREKVLQELARLFNTKVAGVPLLEWQSIWAFSPRVKGVRITPDAALDLISISKE